MSRKWVIAWVTPSESPPGPIDDVESYWLMVNNIDRGWELPGGWVEEGEDSEIAAVRELFEETGLQGSAVQTARNLVDGGDVVWIQIDSRPTPISWESGDASISEVCWCQTPPEQLAWDLNELRMISSYNWSAS